MIVAEAEPGYGRVVDLARELAAEDPAWRFQLSVLDDDGVAVSLHGGEEYGADAIHLQASSAKGVSGIVIGLLVERGLLDLGARVADYWPEFAVRGKGAVTVAQLLSHQAGLIAFTRPIPLAEVGEGRSAAADLASQRPRWAPGTAHGYHSLTIGVLADELVHRVTGMQLWRYYADHVADPYQVDYWIRLPAEQEHRVVEVLVDSPAPAGAPTGSIADAAHERLVSAGAGNTWINSTELRRAGIPSVSGTGSARGLARAYAAAIGTGGLDPLLGADTIEQVGQLQTVGHDLVLDSPTRYATMFQKPGGHLDFGSSSAFGHDGAGGSLAFADPQTHIAFGYTTGRAPSPGGADARALRLARAVRDIRLTAH